jgi:hypothetical protein
MLQDSQMRGVWNVFRNRGELQEQGYCEAMQVNLPDPPLHEGFLIFGNSVSKTEFQGVVTHGLFKTLAPVPNRLERDANLSGIDRLHAEMQRKKKNVDNYAQYIIETVNNGEGFTPEIVLYCEQSLRVETDLNTGLAWILIPHEIKFVPIDGGTQTRARHLADDLRPGLFNKEKIKIVIKHGVADSVAQQIFADCHRVGGNVTTSIAIGMDARDDASQLARFVEEQIPALAGRVNRQKRQLGATDQDLITISALRASVLCFVEGINFVQNQGKPVEVDKAHADELRTASVIWFKTAIGAMNGALMPQERASTFASAPAVWCAIGALGHDALVELTGTEFENNVSPATFRRAFKALAVATLAKVDWSRRGQWLSAGAKRTLSGAITLGGPKETASLVYKALKDGTLIRTC